MRNLCLLLLNVWLIFTATDARAAPETIVVCYPGGAVNARDANGAMNSMLRVVERLGQWQENSFESLFTSKIEECQKLLAEKKPKFAIASLGLYLELHQQHSWLPLVQPKMKGRTIDQFRILARPDTLHSLEELKGKTLGGTVLDEPAFIGRIVFAGKYQPTKDFNLKPSNQAIHTLRALDKGELDAVILNEQQFTGLTALHLQTPLTTIFTSEEIPLMGVVANTDISTADERNRFANALTGMCADSEGKKLCEVFGIDAFVSVDAATFEPMIKLWAKGK
jgi:ABC transporter, phosphonate, periplasmic substrate-binding protein